MKSQCICTFCDLDLSTIQSILDCIAHLNACFPYAHGLVVPSKGKINSVKDILNDNKSGKEKELYRNIDKEEYLKVFMGDVYRMGSQ